MCIECRSTGEHSMQDKRAMTLNLTDAEMQALEVLARKKDLSKTALIRQALRLYQLVDVRTSQGRSSSSKTRHRRKRWS